MVELVLGAGVLVVDVDDSDLSDLAPSDDGVVELLPGVLLEPRLSVL